MKCPVIAPSLLASDFARLGDAVKEIDTNGAEWTHIDVMDGVFVPPITFGAKMLSDIRPLSESVMDVHLMTVNPENHIESFAKAGADYITIHEEASVHLHRVLSAIKDLGKKAGISIVPSTPITAILELLSFVDLVLVMTVNPGYGGQKLIPSCLDKVKDLVKLREEKGYSFLISVDGGINRDTASLARDAGVDVMVSGEAFFKAENKRELLAFLRGGQ